MGGEIDDNDAAIIGGIGEDHPEVPFLVKAKERVSWDQALITS